MRTLRFFMTSILLLFHVFSFAQPRLANSQRRSAEIHIYRISRENLRKVHLKGDGYNEDMLRTFVAKYKVGDQPPPLDRGNYVEVSVIDNHLNYSGLTVDDLYTRIIPSERFVICLYDSLGNIISDAGIRKGSSGLKYDKTTQTYSTNKVANEQVIEIAHNGVYHYPEVHNYRYAGTGNSSWPGWRITKSLWNKTRRGVRNIFHPSERPAKQKHTGFVVFSKPKYKPGETVKLKAYLAKQNGKRYDKPVDIRLKGGHHPTVDTLLTRLEPYRPGMYSYEFKLTDELNLTLDRRYSVSLVTGHKNDNEVGANFGYEDYELKSIRFSLNADKKKYASGDSIKLKMKATDENDMAVYDGRIEVLVTPQAFNAGKMNRMESVFIPDTLWSHTVDMSGASGKELVIPDSVFPRDADLEIKVNCTYLSADNEKHTQSLYITKTKDGHVLDFSLDKGMLTIKELYLGESQPAMAEITIDGENGECLHQASVMLPHTMAVPWNAKDVTVETGHALDYFCAGDARDKQLDYNFYRSNDSIFLKVDNPAGIPFWYTVRKMEKEMARGYTTQLSYAARDTGEDGYSMRLSYLFGGESGFVEGLLPFARKNITMDVTTPTTVYPGQKANVQVAVSDKKGKPVEGADITAYSFTSEFKDYSMPYIAIGGRMRYARPFRNTGYSMEDNLPGDSKSNLTKERWAGAMGLDTMEYYKFLYPDTYYTHKTPAGNGKTLIMPFVVIDGEVQGVHILWIDERLYYVNQSEQLDIYSFEVAPGKHNLRFRTHDREVLAVNFYLEEGKNHVMSFDAGKPYAKIPYADATLVPFVLTSRLLDKKERGYLSDREERELTSQLITVDNNFGETRLPNTSRSVERAGYINAGNTLYYLNHTNRSFYNSTLRARVKNAVLAGPFPKRSYTGGLSNIASVYAADEFLVKIEIEGGNRYTLSSNYQKIKQWDGSVINRKIPAFRPALNFGQEPLTKKDIDSRVQNSMANEMRSASGFVDTKWREMNSGAGGYRLNLALGQDTTGAPITPTLIFIVPEKEEDRKDYQLYYGRTRTFNGLPAGESTLHLIFSDSTSYSYPLKLRKGGRNYLKLDSIAAYDKDTDAARIACNLFGRELRKSNAHDSHAAKTDTDSIMLSPVFNSAYFDKRVITGVVSDHSYPLIGASVRIKGTAGGTVTDFDGRFQIEVDGNATLEVSYIGYITKEVKATAGHSYNIVLTEDSQSLDEVVVVGYGVARSALTGSISTIEYNLQGAVAGLTSKIRIRGALSPQAEAGQLIVVNGLPFDGNLNDIDASSILSINVLKDAAATSVYGARAANGVIMIETKESLSPAPPGEAGVPDGEQGNTMRRNFHDDAFWQPKLKTDDKGEVNFEVTYPDDITNWNAHFIALGGKGQSDTKTISVRSFKALSARLSTPRFAIRGDSLNAVGRVANHFGDSLQLTRIIESGHNKRADDIKIGTSLVDYIPVIATGGDSLTLAYSLRMENGYFDGEERSFPVFEKGMLQTHGDFRVINDSSTYTLNTDPSLGPVTIYAESSGLELFLREIGNIDRYPYLCNEQIASKINALLAKKQIAGVQGKEFKEEKKINSLIRELNKNKNREGLWGWWNKSESVMWISKHIINVLLDAEEAGFKTELDKSALASLFERELKNSLSDLPLLVDKKTGFAKGGLLDLLIFLKRLDAPIDYKAYLHDIDSQLESQTLGDKLKTMLAMSSAGLQESVRIDSLMRYSGKTILGSLYWGETRDNRSFSRYVYRPHETNTENTLMAYRILKNRGGHEKELESIRNYFLEQRQNGTWSNIYEASRIIRAILPDMLGKDGGYADVVMNINGNKTSEFPYTAKAQPAENIRVSKTGTMPLFITAYQEEWNGSPAREDTKGFGISTTFEVNNESAAVLDEGKPAVLQATLDMAGDAEYVQIEIPIPAGCTYESKTGGNYRKEAHREYYKEKVVIFCNKLSKGEHTFTVRLLPRYTGRYTLNPAKAELMYFPVFYGNEEVKGVRIK